MNSSLSINIRRAKPNDAGIIAPLFDAYRGFYEFPSARQAAFDFLQNRLMDKDSVIFLAENKEKELMGFAQLYPSFSSLRMRQIYILNDLFISEDHREKGIGKKLVQASIDFAESTSAASLNLETGQDNYPAQKLYEKLGFERNENYFYYDLPLKNR